MLFDRSGKATKKSPFKYVSPEGFRDHIVFSELRRPVVLENYQVLFIEMSEFLFDYELRVHRFGKNYSF